MDQEVSIWCVTYNHGSYIQSALDGFLKQKTNFEYKVIVYDDASTDETAGILKKYQNKYPGIFHVDISRYNRWRDKTRGEFFYEYEKKMLDTKYVAFCDGDDYWIDENKLQLQVDYMNAHPECVMYIHNAIWKDYVNNTEREGNPFDISGEGDIAVEDLIEQKNGHPPTASFLFRRELLEKDFFFFDAPVGDYTMLLCAAAHGKVHYNSRLMSVYRYRTEGSYSESYQKNDAFYGYYCLGLITFLRQYNKYTKGKYKENIYHVVRSLESSLVQICFSRKIGIQELYNRCIRNEYFLSSECYEIISNQTDEFLLEKKQQWIKELKSFIQGYPHIIIMGTGKYSQILTNILDEMKISFDGYAISEKKDTILEFNDKPIWQLDRIPFESQKVGVLVGIWIINEEEMVECIKKANVLNYYFAFKNGILSSIL